VIDCLPKVGDTVIVRAGTFYRAGELGESLVWMERDEIVTVLRVMVRGETAVYGWRLFLIFWRNPSGEERSCEAFYIERPTPLEQLAEIGREP